MPCITYALVNYYRGRGDVHLEAMLITKAAHPGSDGNPTQFLVIMRGLPFVGQHSGAIQT